MTEQMLYIPLCIFCPFFECGEICESTGEVWTKDYCRKTGKLVSEHEIPPEFCPIHSINEERKVMTMKLTEITPTHEKIFAKIDRNMPQDEKIGTLIDAMNVAHENGNDLSILFESGCTITLSNAVLPEMIELMRGGDK